MVAEDPLLRMLTEIRASNVKINKTLDDALERLDTTEEFQESLKKAHGGIDELEKNAESQTKSRKRLQKLIWFDIAVTIAMAFGGWRIDNNSERIDKASRQDRAELCASNKLWLEALDRAKPDIKTEKDQTEWDTYNVVFQGSFDRLNCEQIVGKVNRAKE